LDPQLTRTFSIMKNHGIKSGAGGRKSRRGFTLVELLVVIAIVGILTTLLVPAMRGLVGVGGRRGGMNVLTTAVEQARLGAMENGVSTYVGFPTGASDPELGYSSVIVMRDSRDDEETKGSVAVTRWQRMPRGVFIDSGNVSEDVPEGAIPKLGGADPGKLRGIRFDRFGKVVPNKAVTLRIGEKASPGGDFLGNGNNYFELTVQPLTGRVTVVDKAAQQ
jgi:prepilin-type N-terminal cleavage/methylation domain-containing protein